MARDLNLVNPALYQTVLKVLTPSPIWVQDVIIEYPI